MAKFEQTVVRFPEPLVMLTRHTSAPLFSLKPYKICCLFHILASFFLLTCPMWTKISSFAINLRISEEQSSLCYFVSPSQISIPCSQSRKSILFCFTSRAHLPYVAPTSYRQSSDYAAVVLSASLLFTGNDDDDIYIMMKCVYVHVCLFPPLPPPLLGK